jgi:pSer/pThr/pTyr-binding forkhead associated (FHA) protein
MELVLYLIMRQGPEPKRRFPLDKDVVMIGRAKDNDIVIEEQQVSRHHAFVIREGNQWIIEDMGSKNGIHIDGKLITKREKLTPGCLVALGPNVLFSMDAAGTPPPDKTPTDTKRDKINLPVITEDETKTAVPDKKKKP